MREGLEPADAGLPADTVAQAPLGDASIRALSLQTVLARRTPVYWSEAVAIVDGVCNALLQEDGTELTVPDISDIALMPEGAIEVRGGGRRADSVQRLARMLHALTSEQAVPAPLRLFVTKWVAWEGSHIHRGIREGAGLFCPSRRRGADSRSAPALHVRCGRTHEGRGAPDASGQAAEGARSSRSSRSAHGA